MTVESAEAIDPQQVESESDGWEKRPGDGERRTAERVEAGTALLHRPGTGAGGKLGGLRLERIAGLPVQLNVMVPLPDFRVADLLRLAPGSVVASAWPSSDDVPLSCGDVRMVWTEFEVVDQTLAVRVTRLV